MEGDPVSGLYDAFYGKISIHSLRMEGDITLSAADMADWTFQSTPSAWRETLLDAGVPENIVFQSTPSAWRETPPPGLEFSRIEISIHSLRMEGDGTYLYRC